MLEERWAELERIPAAVRGVSVEPMLGEVHLGTLRPDWVITGGESDKKAPRKLDLDWLRRLRDECVERGIPLFHKQHGGTHKINGAWGGRELDGIEWSQFPVPTIFT
jgi:protein gp37